MIRHKNKGGTAKRQVSSLTRGGIFLFLKGVGLRLAKAIGTGVGLGLAKAIGTVMGLAPKSKGETNER